MARVQKVSHAGGLEPDPIAISEQVDALLRVVDDSIEFGAPTDPVDPTSAVLAGSSDAAWSTGDHNGTVANIAGSWVEAILTTSGATTLTCIHNLYLHSEQYTVPVSGEPNCRWLNFGTMHDGTLADASTRISVEAAFVGDTVAANEIDIRFNLTVGGKVPTIDSDHPVLVSLFFTKATRGE